MSNIEAIVDSLEDRISKVLHKLEVLKQTNAKLSEELSISQERLSKHEAEVATWVDKYETLKFANSEMSAPAANAIDIAGFVLEDGTRISVKEHWRERSDAGKYLTRIHKKACRLFSVTLGPDYDAAHADHFHLDMGSVETCR